MALPIGKIIDKDGDISMLDIIWHFYGKDAAVIQLLEFLIVQVILLYILQRIY